MSLKPVSLEPESSPRLSSLRPPPAGSARASVLLLLLSDLAPSSALEILKAADGSGFRRHVRVTALWCVDECGIDSRGLAGSEVAIGWEGSETEARSRAWGWGLGGCGDTGGLAARLAEDVDVDPLVLARFRGPAWPLRPRREPC